MRKTRKQLAQELWVRLERGPQYALCEALTPEEVLRRYKGWARSWILAEVAALVPELRHKLDSIGNLKED